MEINEANIQETSTMIEELIENNVLLSVMVWGQPGVGKSEIMYQLGKNLTAKRRLTDPNADECTVHDIRLLLRDPTDLKGIPYFNENDKTMVWAEPTEFKKVKKGDIIFLDELISAVPMVQAAAYQLVLEKRIGEYQLPADVIIIAAGNRSNDRGVTYDMPSPLADRFIHVNVRVDQDLFIEYATKTLKMNHLILSFLMSHTQHFNNFEDGKMKTMKTFTTPRSWVRVAQIFESNMSRESKALAISGIIGEGPAQEFEAYCEMSSKLPAAEDVLHDRNNWKQKLTSVDAKDISVMYSMLVSLCTWLSDKKEKREDISEYLACFKALVDGDLLIKGEKADELRIAVLEMATRRYQLIGFEDYKSDKGGWGNFQNKFKKYLS